MAEPEGHEGGGGSISSGQFKETRVVAAVIHRADRFLVCKRPLQKRHGGLWEFPGGKCEPGESDLAALRRELREELDIEVVDCAAAIFEHRDDGSCFRIAFIPVQVEGAITPLEHDAVEWKTVVEMEQMLLAPTDRQFVEFISKGDTRLASI